MRYTIFLVLAALCLLFSSCGSDEPEKPNILFITTDYQAWEDIPAESDFLNMPAIEKLSKEGIVMSNHYCVAPICMPSRYTIVSGRYPSYHKKWDNGGGWLPDGTPVLMEELKKVGYYTVGIGKMHFSPWERMAGYDVRIIAEGKKNGARDTLLQDDYAKFLKTAGLTRWDYLKLQKSSPIFGLYDWPFEDSLYQDYYIGEQSLRFIEKDSLPEPFFMWVSFVGPHNPWDPPKRYADYYRNMEFPGARYYDGELESKPPDHTRTRYNYTGQLPKYMESVPNEVDSILHLIRSSHYGNLTLIDEQIGRILESLKERGLDGNTLVAFSSDHGSHLGDHESIHKGTHYERSAHVPMIVWFPKYIKPAIVNGFSSHVDIMPTLLKLAGADVPESLPGYDLWPLMTGKVDQVQDHVFNEIRYSYSIITNNYKLGISPKDSSGDFYDRRNDPDELNNLYENSRYKYQIDSLLSVLIESRPWLEEGWPYQFE